MRNGLGVGLWLVAVAALAWGQATSAVLSGIVVDPAGATVPGAKVTLFSSETGFMRPFVTPDSGQFVFPVLQPGGYQLRVERSGFKLLVCPDIVLAAGQAFRITVAMEISSEPQVVMVESASRMLDAASRLSYSLREQTLQALPLQGGNLLNLASTAPGVSGRGAVSNFDNFSPEKELDLSANGRSAVGNIFLLDGLNVTSNILLGVTNLSPNPESIEEFSVQTNTFTVEQGRASSLHVLMVSRGGTNRFRGAGRYFFANQDLRARTVFTDRYEPFKRHNVAGTVGGPLQRNRSFLFSSFEALRSSESQATSVQTFESPQFVAFARSKFPETLGTRVLTEVPLVNVSVRGVTKYARDVVGRECGTPASRMLPCSMPLIMEGQYRPNSSRNGLQYSLRADRHFRDSRERLFVNYYRTWLDTSSTPVRVGTGSTNDFGSRAVEMAWTHSFSSSLLNESSFGGIRVEGNNLPHRLFHIPQIDIAGQSTNIMPGWSGSYAQRNYNWRDVLSWVRGSHTLKFGATYHWSDDAADATRTTARPTFFFNNLLDLVRDQPQRESGAAYNPLTGRPGRVIFGGKADSIGAFVQDEWNAARNLTVTLGLRWDDFGNPRGTQGLQFSRLEFGAGDVDRQFAEAVLLPSTRAYRRRLNHNFSPRAGAAWSPRNADAWRLRGGVGFYQDWISLGESVDRMRMNPPNSISPTFTPETSIKPRFTLGASDTYPFGFDLPDIPAIQFDRRGGLSGTRPNIGVLSPDLTPSRTLTWLAGIERRVDASTLAELNYSGSRTWNALVGTDFNRTAGDLLDGTLDRLNPSFGSMWQIWNGNRISYQALIAALRRSTARGIALQASYTLSGTTDYGQAGSRQNRDGPFSIPYQHNLQKAWADWDARHRFSLTGVWTLPAPTPLRGFPGLLARGWELSVVAVAQSGHPFTVVNRNPLILLRDAAGIVTGLAADSGDYNADGFNYDYPDAPAISFAGGHGRQEYLRGLFTQADFPVPAPGTAGSGRRNAYRNPGLLGMDAGLVKNNRLPLFGDERTLQFRFEFFNVLNRVNLRGVDNNLADSTFGRSIAAYPPRSIQLGMRVLF